MADDDQPIETVDEKVLENADTEPDQDEREEAEASHNNAADDIKPPKEPNILKRFADWYKSKKKYSVPLTVIFFIALLMAVPISRYKILGLVIRKDITITAVDSRSGNEISFLATLDGN